MTLGEGLPVSLNSHDHSNEVTGGRPLHKSETLGWQFLLRGYMWGQWKGVAGAFRVQILNCSFSMSAPPSTPLDDSMDKNF